MNWRKALSLAFAMVFLLSLLPAAGLAHDEGTPTVSTKIEAELLDLLSAKDSADFIIVMAEQADLSAAYQIRDWNARGQYVYNALKQVAGRSQARAKAHLDNAGLSYQAFLAGNELYVRGGNLEMAEDLAKLPEVATIRATRVYKIEPPVPSTALEAEIVWGIQDTRADDFWASFGAKGEGIVVANIDSGVDYTHAALYPNYKCGDGPHDSCWYDPGVQDCSGVNGGPCDTPYFGSYHGTHTMGTMAAKDDPALPYTVGMAPNAKWIACLACPYGGCPDLDLNECADWILAPGGDPDNRPHIVNNSWGGGGNDAWYLPKVNAWRAAGVFPAFSAGNSGPGCNSLGSPGDYQESFGSAAHQSSRQIADFSSRGPSAFGHDPYTKPNISAPGVNVISTQPGNSWTAMGGTSMASPHSAGAVALLWSCNPSLAGQIDQTFEILQDNADPPPAGNCGAPPDDEGNYTYGYGYLNIYQAGVVWCSETGTLEGHVYDADAATPIHGALIEAERQGVRLHAALTDDTGYYNMAASVGTYDVTASKYGYVPQTVANVEVSTDTVTTQDFDLAPAQMYTVDGTVTDSNTGWPLYARIDIDGYLYGPVWTDPETGYYSVDLAEGVQYTFHVRAWTPGYWPEHRIVGPLTGNRTEDFALAADLDACIAPGYKPEIVYSQDFEASDGALVAYGMNSTWEWGVPTSGPGAAHSGANAWATNLDSSYFDYEESYLESPDIDLSSFAGQGLILSWWQWLQTETCCDFGEVRVSNDGGGNWSTVYGPAYGSIDLGWTRHSVPLDASYASSYFRFHFHLHTDSSVVYPGWYVDDLVVFGNCQPQPGGLVVGSVYDDNTADPLPDVTVSNDGGKSTTTMPTPDDPAVDDSFYVLFSPAGSHTFTATKDLYLPDVELVTVVGGEAVRQDFYLPTGRLSFTPASIQATVEIGASANVLSLLNNSGSAPAEFEILENDRGFEPTLAGGTIHWLTREIQGIQVETSDSGSTLAYPGSYQYIPVNPTHDVSILVYTDDWIHLTPDTLVQQALARLGLQATVHVDGDYAGFEANLASGGPWDLVIYSSENYYPSSSVKTALRNYLQDGGKLAATEWLQKDYPGDPLWAEMGFVYVDNYLDPLPTYWWDPSHSIFTEPEDAPEWLARTAPSSSSQGTYIDPLANGRVVAGYSTTPAPSQGALVIRDDGAAIYKAIRDVTIDADADADGTQDGVELWENIITGLLYGFDVPWLSENPISGTLPADTVLLVDLAFDAGVPEVTQPGEYYATLQVTHDTPYGPLRIPVTMTATSPPTWGKLEGTVIGLGYCDENPAPLEEAEVYVEASDGMSWTLTTDENGHYAWWLNESHSPLTITVTYPEHEVGQATGVMVSGQATTTVDFDLRWLWPCVSLEPTSMDVAIMLGISETRPLTLYNGGALATFAICEQDRGWQPSGPGGGDGQLHLVQESKEPKPEAIAPASLPRASGGPDPFGYVFADSNELHGPTYDWIEIAPPAGGSGAPVGLAGVDDGWFWPLTLPFRFNFYGRDYTQIAVASNGAVYFDDRYLGYGNRPIPGPTGYDVNKLIAHLWDDLYVRPGEVYYLAQDDMFIIEYYQVSGCCISPDSGTWQMILFANGNILFQYQDANFGRSYSDYGAGATVGIQDVELDPTWGLQYSYNTPALSDGLAICFAYPGNLPDCKLDVPWLSEEPVSGTIAADGSQRIDVTFDAETVGQPGDYLATLRVKSDDPVNSTIGVPVTMTALAPETWGKLEGTVIGLGYCDENPAPLEEAEVYVEASDGMVWTLTTDENGHFAWWLNESHSPLFVAAIHPEHETGVADGVMVTAQQTTTVDFDLRWSQPCVSVEPALMEVTVLRGTTETQTLMLHNDGVAPTPFRVQEREGTVRQRPHVTGPFAEPTLLAPPEHADAASTEGLGLPPAPASAILAAGTVIQSWQPANQGNAWGIAYSTDETVWVGEGWWGVNMIHEYRPDGTPTGRSWPYPWNPWYGPADDAFNWNTGMVWTVDVGGDDCLHEMDPANGYTGNLICGPWGSSQRGVAYDPDTDTWFVGGWNEGVIYHINSNGTLLDSAFVGLAIAGLAYNPQTQHLFVMVNNDPNWVYVLDANAGYSIVGQFSVGQGFGPYGGAGLELDCDGNLWAVDQNTNTIYQFESGETADLCAVDVPWLSEEPITGTLGADSTLPIRVNLTGMPTMTAGIYTAALRVKSGDPLNPTFNVPVTMTLVHAPICGFVTSSPDELGATTTFTNTTAEGFAPTTYRWNFGDGSAIDTAVNPTHTYDLPALYTVVLTAENPYGAKVCTDTTSVEGVVASFVSNSPVILGKRIAFTNTTASNPGVVRWFWTFGDSGLSEMENPTHLYKRAGVYTVTLFAANVLLATDQISAPENVYDIYIDTVTVILPHAYFVYLPVVVKGRPHGRE